MLTTGCLRQLIISFICYKNYGNKTWPKLISNKSHQTDSHFILNELSSLGRIKVMSRFLIAFNFSGRKNTLF